ncbi:HrpE/YscL family type III secretion apparatus protein [Sodalis endosymbiont of Spalangia cameroni]|uniref:HrpE/YscL family type III secretion apparatus protein n=1 Tax=Sodalis praecaptivus TaxID=1239307 RepID=UPI0031F90EFC
MSAGRLTIIELAGPAPDGPVIPADWFATRLTRDQTLKQAERQAELILGAARRKATALLRQSARHQRRARRELLAERARLEQALLRRGERQWLTRHVGRVLDEAEQERLLIRHAAERIQNCMAQVLSAWYEQQPADAPLCARLARQVEKLAGEGTLTLRVHPALVPRMRAEWGERLTIVAAPHYARAEARLASAHCAVDISLDRHFAQLLDWLRGATASSGEPDESERRNIAAGFVTGCARPAGAGGAEDGPAGDGAA